jgi:hypothetical protein
VLGVASGDSRCLAALISHPALTCVEILPWSFVAPFQVIFCRSCVVLCAKSRKLSRVDEFTFFGHYSCHANAIYAKQLCQMVEVTVVTSFGWRLEYAKFKSLTIRIPLPFDSRKLTRRCAKSLKELRRGLFILHIPTTLTIVSLTAISAFLSLAAKPALFRVR